MATSPNYAWAEPDNSSLVKNGASDIRTLGDAIDTSVWNVGFGQAGKNKIINGDFTVNQRAFTSVTADGTFTFDRFFTGVADGTVTFTPQIFTPGAAPVAGYEATNYLRIVTTGQTLTTAQARISQRIEDARTFAGQTVTVSFWAKASTGTPSVAVNIAQTFGTGGSSSVNVNGQKTAITTSWARYSKTFSVPSVSGATIGTGSALRLNIWTSAGSSNATVTDTLGIQSATIDIWGVQMEYGSKATPFQTASGGSQQAELAMCQRYYYRQTAVAGSSSNYSGMAFGFNTSATASVFYVKTPATMRTVPTSVDYSTLCTSDIAAANFTVTNLVLAGSGSTTDTAVIETTVAAGQTQYRPAVLRANNSTTAYLGFSAEL